MRYLGIRLLPEPAEQIKVARCCTSYLCVLFATTSEAFKIGYFENKRVRVETLFFAHEAPGGNC